MNLKSSPAELKIPNNSEPPRHVPFPSPQPQHSRSWFQKQERKLLSGAPKGRMWYCSLLRSLSSSLLPDRVPRSGDKSSITEEDDG